jgi:hypothetical protein
MGSKESGMTTEETGIVVAGGGDVVRDGFGERSLERRGETATTAAAARAKAEIEARYIVAMRRPRDFDVVRTKLLASCKRPGFAKRAYYAVERYGAKPGRLTGTPGVVEGLSVRFAEDAIRNCGNISQTTRITYEDTEKRELNVAVIDLESNSGYERDLVVYKTQERSKLRKGQVAIATRVNSAGATVYTVETTEEDLLVKEGALVSRIFRTLGLRLIPADILEECERQIVKTVRDEDAKDPDAARKEILDAFAELHVPIDELKKYIGHDVASCSPAEMMTLRGLFSAIRAGEITWADAYAEKVGDGPAEGKRSVEEVLKERAAKRGEAAPKVDAGAEGAFAYAIAAALTAEAVRAVVGKVTDSLRANGITKEQATKLYELADKRGLELEERKGT